jgi:hypothetical protein
MEERYSSSINAFPGTCGSETAHVRSGPSTVIVYEAIASPVKVNSTLLAPPVVTRR